MHTQLLRLVFVCTLCAAAVTTAADAASFTTSDDPPELKAARAAIEAKNYDAALAQLKGISVKNQSADVYSLMGFALRKTGDRAQSMTYYRKALDADPTHRGALEYQGELYVELGQIDKAKENLAKLEKICWFGCEEQGDLKEAIAHAPKAK
jgi:tetratricopeptide (TPR) repeat protein